AASSRRPAPRRSLAWALQVSPASPPLPKLDEAMPDAKTMGRWGVAVGPAVVKQIHERIVQIARDHRVAQGRRMRVDTTVVETNIHYPTDSSLLGDGVRVLTRTMQKIT